MKVNVFALLVPVTRGKYSSTILPMRDHVAVPVGEVVMPVAVTVNVPLSGVISTNAAAVGPYASTVGLVMLPVTSNAEAPPFALTRSATPDVGAKIWLPVHIGEIAWESNGAPSERMNVVALPLTVASPTVPVGFAAEGTAAGVDHPGIPPPTVSTCPLVPIPRRVAVPAPGAYMMSPVVVIGERASKAVIAVVCPVPPEPIASVVERPAAVPDVFWFHVGTLPVRPE